MIVEHKTQFDTYISISCSVGHYFEWPNFEGYEFNDEGPVYGPNGEWELDPDNDQCCIRITNDSTNGLCYPIDRPVFATCKNNCPGGELSFLTFFCNNYKHLI